MSRSPHSRVAAEAPWRRRTGGTKLWVAAALLVTAAACSDDSDTAQCPAELPLYDVRDAGPIDQNPELAPIYSELDRAGCVTSPGEDPPPPPDAGP